LIGDALHHLAQQFYFVGSATDIVADRLARS
jgi:hypothetical protein